MNIYFLVEGRRTEAEVYPAWLQLLLPQLKKVDDFDKVCRNNYYLFSSEGIPFIEDDIINALHDINNTGRYDYFVICLDADRATVAQREEKVLRRIKEASVQASGVKIIVIVQNRCIETWFLGNRKVYSRFPGPAFAKYSRFYNVAEDDPESMEKPDEFAGSIADYHFKYIRAMLQEKNIRYSKANSTEVQKEHYLEALRKRVAEEPSHLITLNRFFSFCERIGSEMKGGTA